MNKNLFKQFLIYLCLLLLQCRYFLSLFNIFFIVSSSLEVIVKADGFQFLATMGVVISPIQI